MGAHRHARADDLAAARLLERVAVIANEATSFRDAIKAALDVVCEYTGWPVGHAYLPDAENPSDLDPTGVWHLEDPARFERFRTITEHTPLHRGAGLPGRVWESGKPAWITDVSVDPNFPRNRHGEIVVRGGFGFPVLASQEMVAVLEFFSDRPQRKDDRLLDLVSHVGTQLGRVAEREAAAAAMRKQSEEIIGLIERAYDAFVSIDSTGTITGWNASAESMFGWSRHEAIGRPLAETIIPERYRDAHRRGLARYLETREGHVLNRYIELSAMHREGHEFPVELAIWPIGVDGKTTFCAFVRDISQRKEAEAEVARLAAIVQSSDDAMIAKTMDGTVLTWNAGAERMYGYSADEMVGRSIAVLIAEESDREVDEIMGRLRAGESFHNYEAIRRRKDGSMINVALTISPIKDATGAVVGAATIARDVSDKKRAEEALRANERRLLDAQRIVRVGSWEWDVEHDVVTWSDQLYRNFGISREDLVPSFDGYLSLVHPGDRDRVRGLIEQALGDHEHFEFEHRALLGDGSVRVHLCNGDVFIESGRPVRMAGTSQDVTERREAEDRLVAAYEHEREMVVKLKEADAAKVGFVSSVSHELRTPLTSIVGYVDLLLDSQDVTEEQRDMLDVVHRNSVRLLNLIDDLLTVSRLETGSFKLSLEPVAIGPLVESVIQAMIPSAQEGSIELLANVAPNTGFVLGDPEQLERMLLNLLSNAVKFTPAGGQVRIGARMADGDVELSVADSGIGISEAEQSKLFTRFFRGSNAEAARGTGLGLAIVKAIVDEHGGRIDVKSAVGEGTTMTVRLKAMDVRAMAETA